MTPFSDPEIEYLAVQLLGRLATVGPDGMPQNNPVSFRYNAELGTIDIGGHRMGATRKFRNVGATGKAAFVVDDVVSVSPWQVRCLEIRGTAEALHGQPPQRPGFSPEIIRIRPRLVFSFGIDPAEPGMQRRNVG